MARFTENIGDLIVIKKPKRIKTNAVVVTKNWRNLILCHQEYYSDAMHKLLQNPDAMQNYIPLKIDTTTTVGMIAVDGKSFVVKRFNIKSFFHGLKRAIRPTRAMSCWFYAHRFLELNIPTPKPIAVIEKRIGPFRRASYYICEYVEGTLASEVFANNNSSDEQVKKWAKLLADTIAKMQQHKIRHGDLKTTNIIMVEGIPYFIDLDATREYRSLLMFNRIRQKDILRFLGNWSEGQAVKKLFKNLFVNMDTTYDRSI